MAEGDAPSQTNPNRILLRQANPLVVRNGKAQKGLFRIDTDPETGERAISVELSSPEYSARDAYERHVGGRPETMQMGLAPPFPARHPTTMERNTLEPPSKC